MTGLLISNQAAVSLSVLVSILTLCSAATVSLISNSTRCC